MPTPSSSPDNERERACPTPPVNTPDESDLVGLAFSGGGIRSASFNIGFLQGLAKQDALWIFDYLSTVSGGGFAGGWWSAWLSRTKRSGDQIFPLPEELEPRRREATSRLLSDSGDSAVSSIPDGSLSANRDDPIHFVRMFSNYLTPRAGLMSPDVWRLVAFFLRGLLFNWLVLLPIVFAAVLAAQSFFFVDSSAGKAFLCDSLTSGTTCAASLQTRIHFLMTPTIMIAAAYSTLIILWLIESAADPGLATFAAAILLGSVAITLGETYKGSSSFSWLPSAGASVATLVWYAFSNHIIKIGTTRADRRNWLTIQQARLLKGTALTAFFLLLAGFGHDICAFFYTTTSDALTQALKKAGGWGALALTVVSGLYTFIKKVPSTTGEKDRPTGVVGKLLLAVAPPLVVTILLLLMASLAHQLLIVTFLNQARLVQVLCIPAAGFAMVEVAFALYEGAKAIMATGDNGSYDWLSLLSPKRLVLVAASLGSFILLRRAAADSSPYAVWNLLTTVPLAIVLSVILVIIFAVYLLSVRWEALARTRATVLLCIAAATAALAFLLSVPQSTPSGPIGSLIPLLWVCILVGGVIALGWLIDPNLISLHAFYKSRLTRAYLGASNTTRMDAEITDAVPGDDIRLTELWNHDSGGAYHLINTSRNLVGGSDLASAQRLAENFIMSRYHCGSGRAGYRCTAEYMRGELSLATALAVSGAAVSPTMGSQSPSAAMSLLLSLFNVRLGFWAPTPSKLQWYEPQARLWPVYALRETIANTGNLGTYSYLTDGGHFDNTGLYALIERACRFIVVCDCGADPKVNLDDIGCAIRRSRIDFGVEIDLTIDQFVLAATTPRIGPTHIIYGTIRYQREHLEMLGLDPATSANGRIIWVKPTVTQLCAADVHQYHRAHDDFPQEPTADQWYDESQFESYRRLGFESATQVCSMTAPVPGRRALVRGDFATIPGWFGA